MAPTTHAHQRESTNQPTNQPIKPCDALTCRSRPPPRAMTAHCRASMSGRGSCRSNHCTSASRIAPAAASSAAAAAASSLPPNVRPSASCASCGTAALCRVAQVLSGTPLTILIVVISWNTHAPSLCANLCHGRLHLRSSLQRGCCIKHPGVEGVHNVQQLCRQAFSLCYQIPAGRHPHAAHAHAVRWLVDVDDCGGRHSRAHPWRSTKSLPS